jgi:pyridoxal biosynthesis lyase PdxS
MALEKIPADIRVTGGVARMSDPKIIKVSSHPNNNE